MTPPAEVIGPAVDLAIDRVALGADAEARAVLLGHGLRRLGAAQRGDVVRDRGSA